MRISPVVGLMSRRCTETTEFKDYNDRKVVIEKETVVTIPVYSLHTDSEYYPNPYVFDPDRFSAANGGIKSYKDKGVYLAFGDGPRICLGMRFGITQVKAAVIEIVRNYELTVSKKMKLPVVYDPKNFLLVPVGGIWLNMKPVPKVE